MFGSIISEYSALTTDGWRHGNNVASREPNCFSLITRRLKLEADRHTTRLYTRVIDNFRGP